MIELDDYGKRVYRQFVQYRMMADIYALLYRYDSMAVLWYWKRMLRKTVEVWRRT